MYARLKALYQAGKLTVEQLNLAVEKGWITDMQRASILGVI